MGDLINFRPRFLSYATISTCYYCGRLIGDNAVRKDDVTYAYDPVGNRTQQTDSGVITSYGYDVANQLVTAIPGAIAFIDSKDVKPGSKVVRVDGRLPGEGGYPLR